MRVLFLGTPEFGKVILSHLLGSDHEVVGVVTQPPRPRGRGLQVVDPPAAQLARESGIPVFQPEKLRVRSVREELAALGADIFVTAAFGRILRPKLFQTPPRGSWNVHTSLLPKHRGAAPAVSAILAGDLWTGVSVFQLDEGMDTGPLIAQRMTPIGPQETSGQLTERLADLGGQLLVESLTAEERESLPRRPQLEALATHSRLLTKEDGRVRWNRSAVQVDRQVRAVTPWPGGFSFLDGVRVRIHALEPCDEIPRDAVPGTVLSIDESQNSGSLAPGSGVVVACGRGAVRLTELQREGKKRQDALDWARGVRLQIGQRFDA